MNCLKNNFQLRNEIVVNSIVNIVMTYVNDKKILLDLV